MEGRLRTSRPRHMKRRRPALSTHCDAILDANNAGGGNRCDGDGVEAILTCVVTADSEIYTTASRLTTFAAVSRVMFAGVKFRDRAAACFQSFMAVQMYISAVETDVAPQKGAPVPRMATVTEWHSRTGPQPTTQAKRRICRRPGATQGTAIQQAGCSCTTSHVFGHTQSAEHRSTTAAVDPAVPIIESSKTCD